MNQIPVNFQEQQDIQDIVRIDNLVQRGIDLLPDQDYWTERYVECLLQDDRNRFLLARQEQSLKLLGFVHYRCCSSPTALYWTIEWAAVHPSVQRLSVATRMSETLLLTAEQEQVDHIECIVRESCLAGQKLCRDVPARLNWITASKLLKNLWGTGEDAIGFWISPDRDDLQFQPDLQTLTE